MCLKRMNRNSVVFLSRPVNFSACEQLQCYSCSRCILSITREVIRQGTTSWIPVEMEDKFRLDSESLAKCRDF